MPSEYLPIVSVVSSVIVVLISGAVTLYSKQIDAQQKKEEHNRSLKTLYITRKLDAAQASVALWTLELGRLEWARNFYINLDTGKETREASFKKKFEEAEAINTKLREAHFARNSSFYVYFSNEFGALNNEEVIERYNAAQKKLSDSLNKKAALVFTHESLEGKKGEQDTLFPEYVQITESVNEHMKRYMDANSEAQKMLRDACDKIREYLTVYDIV